MTSSDQSRWNERYSQGAYEERLHPSVLLEEHVPEILAAQRIRAGIGEEPAALDLACGAGRNALYLASLGYRVSALDISGVALERARESAQSRGLQISWGEHDLDQGLPEGLPACELIVIMRYLDLSLITQAGRHLRPGGYLICEVHLQSDEAVAGPRSAEFRARPGEVLTAAAGLDIEKYQEGLIKDPDGKNVALAQLIARRPY